MDSTIFLKKKKNEVSPVNTVGLIIQEASCESKMPKYILDDYTPLAILNTFSATYMKITEMSFTGGNNVPCSFL
jgi:hypothetical protein